MARATSAALVVAGRPAAAYFARTRCRCVRTVVGAICSWRATRSLLSVREPRDQYFLFAWCKVWTADGAVVEHRPGHPWSGIGRVASCRSDRVDQVLLALGLGQIGDRPNVQGRKDHFISCDVRVDDYSVPVADDAIQRGEVDVVAPQLQFEHDNTDA